MVKIKDMDIFQMLKKSVRNKERPFLEKKDWIKQER